MTLLSNGNDVRGKMVQLTDSITLNIELFDQYKGIVQILCMSFMIYSVNFDIIISFLMLYSKDVKINAFETG